MKRLHQVAASLLACATALAIALPTPAIANSARTHWEGVAPTGTIVIDETCPIVVNHETLVFDIHEFPQAFYGTNDDPTSYSAHVSATYEFHNPADYAVKATLAFPFGNLPDYMPETITTDLETGAFEPFVSDSFGVTIDGETANVTLRHTLSYYYDKFDHERDIALLQDDYIADPFYTPELPVTKFTYEVSGIPEDNQAATIGFRWTPRDDAKIMLIEQSGLQRPSTDSNDVIVDTWAHNGRTVTLYVLGNAPDGIMAGLYKDGSCTTGLDGRITQTGTQAMTFEEFVLQEWEEDSAILQHDWYNAMIAHLNRCDVGKDGVLMTAEFGSSQAIDITYSLMRWYEYDLEFEPGQTVSNTVTAPMYPSIDASYEPSLFGYSYLLSPAQTWSDFGKLDIRINTPYHMLESNHEGFERIEGDNGYELSLNGLPEGELTFTLSESDNPEPPSFARQYSILLPILTMVALPILALVALIGLIGLIGLIVGIVWKRRRNRS